MERLLTTMPTLSNSPLIRSVPHSRFSRDMVVINSRTSALRGGRPPRERDFQRQNKRPALPMPAHHRVGGDEGQLLAPAGIEPGEPGSTAACPRGAAEHAVGC